MSKLITTKNDGSPRRVKAGSGAILPRIPGQPFFVSPLDWAKADIRLKELLGNGLESIGFEIVGTDRYWRDLEAEKPG